MYLHLRPKNRFQLFDSFSSAVNLLVDAKDGIYLFALLNVGSSGKYDLVLDLVSEKVSKKRYVQARFVQNPTNKVEYYFNDIERRQSFDVLSLFPPECLLNGYLQVGREIPSSVLDDYTTLMSVLDNFFDPNYPTTVESLNTDILKYTQSCQDIIKSDGSLIDAGGAICLLVELKSKWKALTGREWIKKE